MKLLDKVKLHADRVSEWGQFALKELAQPALIASGVVATFSMATMGTAAAAMLAPVIVGSLGLGLSGLVVGLTQALRNLQKIDPNRTSTERICRYADSVRRGGGELSKLYLKEVVSHMSPERLALFEKELSAANTKTAIDIQIQKSLADYRVMKPGFSGASAKPDFEVGIQLTR